VSEGRGGDQWKPRLLKAVSREGQQVGGFGKVLFEVTYSDGLPLEVRVVARHPLYRLDRDCAIDSHQAAR
jgi:hypothetical protein